jgi:DNA-directed RNA polymerase-3 subunit RPC5
VKKAGGDTAAELTQQFMKAANVEQWHKLQYSDEDVRTTTLEIRIAN